MGHVTAMEPEKLLLGWGIALLAVSALLGFVQQRHRARPEAFARLRLVHNGGTAGAVQLLGLAAVWGHFGRGPGITLLATGLVTATVALLPGTARPGCESTPDGDRHSDGRGGRRAAELRGIAHRARAVT